MGRVNCFSSSSSSSSPSSSPPPLALLKSFLPLLQRFLSIATFCPHLRMFQVSVGQTLARLPVESHLPLYIVILGLAADASYEVVLSYPATVDISISTQHETKTVCVDIRSHHLSQTPTSFEMRMVRLERESDFSHTQWSLSRKLLNTEKILFATNSFAEVVCH
jgi:hypothetical protein